MMKQNAENTRRCERIRNKTKNPQQKQKAYQGVFQFFIEQHFDYNGHIIVLKLALKI